MDTRESSPGPITDDVLAERIRAGDDSAFTQLFRLHYANLVAYAESFLGDQDAAEEVVCDVFAWLHLHRETWHPGSAIRPYLFRAVRNQVLNSRRLHEREATRHAEFTDTLDPSVLPDTEFIRGEGQLLASLHRGIAQLPQAMQEIIAMRWTHGLSYDEISTTLGMTVPAARMQVSRALQKLRQILPKEILE